MHAQRLVHTQDQPIQATHLCTQQGLTRDTCVFKQAYKGGAAHVRDSCDSFVAARAPAPYDQRLFDWLIGSSTSLPRGSHMKSPLWTPFLKFFHFFFMEKHMR